MKLFLASLLIVMIIFNLVVKSKDKYLMLIFNTCNSLGAVTLAFFPQISNFYISDNNIETILLLYIIINFSFWIVNFYKRDKLIQFNILLSHKKQQLLPILVVVPILVYILIYYNKLPIYNIINNNFISESQRPDVTGAIPRYFTFTLFLLGIYLPLFINIFYKNLELGENRKSLLVFPTLLIPWVIMFDKSSLFEVIFFILIINPVFFNYHKKLSKKNYTILIAFLILLGILTSYGFIRALYGDTMFFDIRSMINIVFGRIALISNIILSKIIDIFMDSSWTIPEGLTLRRYIFEILYSNREFGGAPTNFAGSIVYLLRNKYLVYLFTFIVSILVFSTRRLIYRLRMPRYKFAVLYLQYYGAIILSVAYLEDYLLRTIVPIVFFIILDNFNFRSTKQANSDRCLSR